jgi:hypothetical protein
MPYRPSHNIVLMPPNPNNMEVKPNDPSPQICFPLSPKTTSNTSQRVIGSIIYYDRAVNLMVIMVINTFASKQAKGTDNNMLNMKQLIDYLATHPDMMVQFYASDIITNIHLDKR